MRSEFDLDTDLVYLNHAAVSPWPRRTAEAVKRFAEENARYGAAHYTHWLAVEQALREQLARLINAPSPADIALVKNTSEALSLIDYGLDWRPGDNVVSIAQEFPSNRIVWESLRGRGVELRLLDLYATADPESGLTALCDERTRIISVSSVQYARGFRLNLNKLGGFCAAHGILLCVDAIQSLGAVPFDVTACKADFVVADGHKWMLGPEGLALFYAAPVAREQLRIQQYGWHMVAHAGDYDRTDWVPAHDARRFECGSPNMLGIHALHASLSLLLQVGTEAVFERILQKTAYLSERISELSAEILSPQETSRRAGILSFRMPGLESQQIHKRLTASGVVCALRGGGIRFSPHFYTPTQALDRAVAELRRHSRGG